MDYLNPHEVKEALVGNAVLANLSHDTPILPEADKLAAIEVAAPVAPVTAFLSASNPESDLSKKLPDNRMEPL